MKRSLALASAMLVTGLLAGCGGGGGDSEVSATERYCDSLADTKKEIGAVESGDLASADLQKVVDSMHELAAQSPDTVQQEWETVDAAFTDLERGFEDAGLKLADLPKLMENPNELPEGVDQQKLMALAPKMQQAFASEDMQTSMDTISKHAKDECDIELGA